jgi:predicted dithiol-disulfide oxidoreductase (DUF899 family)
LFPNESDEYRSARDALLQEEIALRRHTEAVAEQRRSLPLGGEVPSDYVFAGAEGSVRLSELFEDGKDTLFLYNFIWRHTRLLSSAGTTYNDDYHGESDGRQHPIARVFARRDGAIHHFWSSELYFAPNDPGQHPRHVDFLWPLWAVLDRTPNGRGSGWEPELDYH